jgi:S-adenosylmethionine:tRNA ribosyltransferase-isomerase
MVQHTQSGDAGIAGKTMELSDFDFELPEELIAQHPLEERDASRMLVMERKSAAFDDRHFRDLPELLRGDELLVLNNTRVLPARLFGRREGLGAQKPGEHSPMRAEHLKSSIEVLLVRQIEPDLWETLVRPGRKIPVGERIVFGEGELEARVEGRGGYGLRLLRFSSPDDFAASIARLGHIPLPPYIRRADEPGDRERYQTVYAKQGSAVAAPTAGLHFTAELLELLRTRGIEIAEITLDVGLGTFEPVRTERLEDHKIHAESYNLPDGAAQAIVDAKKEGRPILAVGTTVVRALEDAAEKSAGGKRLLATGPAEAEIFIYPGKPIRIVDQMLTNFHLPRSSLLALVAAFAGREQILRAYGHAVEQGYRFYSYGDCMLIR